MRAITVLSSTALLASATSALAGAPSPGPEIGGGYVGLAILALTVGAYLVVRRLRKA